MRAYPGDMAPPDTWCIRMLIKTGNKSRVPECTCMTSPLPACIRPMGNPSPEITAGHGIKGVQGRGGRAGTLIMSVLMYSSRKTRQVPARASCTRERPRHSRTPARCSRRTTRRAGCTRATPRDTRDPTTKDLSAAPDHCTGLAASAGVAGRTLNDLFSRATRDRKYRLPV